MEPLKLPGEGEIGAAYEQGKAAMIALFYATFEKMAARVQ